MLRETERRRDHVKMKNLRFMLVAFIIGGAASPVMGQNQYSVYSVHDLGTLGGTSGSQPNGINGAGQVVGYAFINSSRFVNHAFRTAANRPINPATDDLGTLGGEFSSANGINSFGQVVGDSLIDHSNSFFSHAFRTAANRPIYPATDDLRTLGGNSSSASGINDSGQVVGSSLITGNTATHEFRTSANRPINPATDDLGTLGGNFSNVHRWRLWRMIVSSMAFRAPPKNGSSARMSSWVDITRAQVVLGDCSPCPVKINCNERQRSGTIRSCPPIRRRWAKNISPSPTCAN